MLCELSALSEYERWLSKHSSRNGCNAVLERLRNVHTRVKKVLFEGQEQCLHSLWKKSMIADKGRNMW